MYNFKFYNPVQIIFGKGQIAQLAKQVTKGSKILMTYGGGSIKKNGVYEQVMLALKETTVIEFSGIEPNPHYETLMKAVEIVKAEKVDFILAVGGGSVIDGTKFIAAAACFTGSDCWDILGKQAKVDQAVPFGTVLTLPATGSEMNCGAVITRAATQEKLAFSSPAVFPKFSIMDPEVTYSLPKHQVANGIVDTYVHVMEQYFTYPDNAPIQERFAESILTTLHELAPALYNDETPNYDDRANFMWSATVGLNSWISVGVRQDWATHHIGHELTAFHGLDHAVTLAIVLPGVMERMAERRSEKLLQYGERVLGVDPTCDCATKIIIDKTEAFFNSLGIKTRLSQYGIGQETIDKIVDRFTARGTGAISAMNDIDLEDLKAILESRL
ncbi:MAG: iron-containing alcohol dehydrogenase [Marinifilaceae bacterium]